MLKKPLLFLLTIATGASMAAAQSLSPTVISSSGGSGSSSGTHLSWTTGELLVQNYSADTLMLTQGFEQGEYNITTAVDELQGMGMDVAVYPNPVSNMLNVDFKGQIDQTVRVRLMNLNGKLILAREYSSPSQVRRMSMNGVAPGTYMLEVRIDGKRKAFKIVKH